MVWAHEDRPARCNGDDGGAAGRAARAGRTEIDKAPPRAGHRQRTDLTRILLYLSNLGDRAFAQVMDTYRTFKTRDLAKIRDESSEE
ncbi:hypothetical protein [Actinomadura rubrisoli]|uniref:Uncharacterized protein n=1 Tax=Actinomadura rubrisoli TaxID=2530368 RepID=A0A4R5BEZ6_9ACTN|nr:hypothetical protein [Actinomadura rubrisoli]TDD82202.1 hypothetical protein E1298_23020 [Actinomadura rubrisoli]